MKIKTNKKTGFPRFIISVLILFLGLFSPLAGRAALWPGVDPPIQRMLDTIHETTQGIIMGTLKQQAAIALNNQISALISGGRSGQAMFITNWQDYLVNQPMNQAVNYMNDYISQMTLGRGSLTGYSAEGFMGNYLSSLQSNTTSAINQAIEKPKVTYEGDPSNMFESGSFKNLNLYLSGVNNPWSFNQAVSAEYEKKLEEKKVEAQIKSISGQGFIGKQDEQGNTVYPAIMAKENITNVQDLGNKIIADAKNIPEVITATVSQIVTRALQQGFTEVQMKINSEINQANMKLQRSIQVSGPGGRF